MGDNPPISHDDILIDGDTAWWIITAFGEQYRYSDFEDLDRPCDLCGGEPTHMDTGAECHGCSGTGRHTFTLDVECDEPDIDRCEDQGVHNGPTCEERRCFKGRFTITVHVVEVLPIQNSTSNEIDTIWDRGDGTFWIVEESTSIGEPPVGNPVKLPPNAAPGKWAVRLAESTCDNCAGKF